MVGVPSFVCENQSYARSVRNLVVRVEVLTDWAREGISVAVLDNIMCVL